MSSDWSETLYAALTGPVGATVVLVLYSIGVLLVMLYSIGQFHLLYYYLRLRKRTDLHPPMPVVGAGQLPFVTVQLPMFNERYVAAAVIDSCAALEYPRDRFELQVVDDSNDDTRDIVDERAAFWNARGVKVSVARRDNRRGFKAGAMAAATPAALGEIIAIFDADFRPHSDFLLRTVPYFANANVGAVQARWGHINRDYSLLTRAQTLLHDAFFLVEQETRHRAGFFIRFNGSAGLWRKSCIDDAGGWQSDTLSEDFDLCLRAQMRGWKFIYTCDVEAPAEIPVTIQDYKAQQFRWTKGRGQVIRKLLFPLLRTPLPPMVKFHAVFDLLNVIIIPGIFLIAITSSWFIVALRENPWMMVAAAAFGVSQINIVLVPWFSWVALRHYRKTVGGTLIEFAKTFPPFVFLLVGSTLMMCVALVDGFRNKPSFFHRTAKYNIVKSGDTWRSKLYRPTAVSALTWFEGLLALCFMGALALDFRLGSYAFAPFHFSLSLGFSVVFLRSLFKA
ncbi:MAG: glycosyltransferase [Phycisphaerae bacterium]|nr:glycosyltransferase [Gemmatimonadaceae bacterium]